MRAELIIDLHGIGNEVGKALGRDATTLPSLSTVAELWKNLGLDVTAMHIVVAGSTTPGDTATFNDLHTTAWWKTEQSFFDDQTFEVTLSMSPRGDEGPVGLDELVTTLALHRSDALKEQGDSSTVVVMSTSPHVGPAVTHARGVPVRIASTLVHDSGLAHTRLELSWMGLLKDRFAAVNLPGVELRGGRPWKDGIAVSTPYNGTEGRMLDVAVRPSFAESVAIFDPAFFAVSDGTSTASPRDAGLAAVVHTLGLGSLLHIEDASLFGANDTTIAATTYRFAADNSESPLVVASARPSMIALTSALDTYAIPNPQRVIRLCLPERDSVFDEAPYATNSTACRVVIERTLTEPLFPNTETDNDPSAEAGDGRHLSVVPQSAIPDDDAESSSRTDRSPSPTLTLYANPNTIREVSGEWRAKNKRRFLLLGATGAEATPADASDGTFLPISLGGCTDFLERRPALRPGCVVEGVMHADGGRWLVVSDPIERRRRRRMQTPEHAETASHDEDNIGAA